jgi:hypothetical protein
MSMETHIDEGAVSDADRAAIHAAATDYIAAWLDNDADRMARCLHESLVKRAVEPDGSIDEMSRDDMVAATTARERQGTYEVTVLDTYGDSAVAKVVSTQYVDYLHIARFEDRWQLLNVLWQPRVTE